MTTKRIPPAEDAPVVERGRFDEPFRKRVPTSPGGLQLREIPDPTLPRALPAKRASEPELEPVDIDFGEEPDTSVKSARALDKRHGELVAENAKLHAELAARDRDKDARDRREIADAPKTLRVQYSQGVVRVGVPTALVLGIIGLVLTQYYKHRDDPPPSSSQCVTRAEFDEYKRTNAEKINDRVGPLETNVGFLMNAGLKK